jgi:hypothetical protein
MKAFYKEKRSTKGSYSIPVDGASYVDAFVDGAMWRNSLPFQEIFNSKDKFEVAAAKAAVKSLTHTNID